MGVRAKFRVHSLTDSTVSVRDGASSSEKPAIAVSLQAVQASEDPGDENTMFGGYTPHGDISMTITNEAASDQFRPGAEFYVDFTPIEG